MSQSANYNVNQLTSRSGVGPLPVHFGGTINEPASVTVKGQTAQMNAAGTVFDATLSLPLSMNCYELFWRRKNCRTDVVRPGFFAVAPDFAELAS